MKQVLIVDDTKNIREMLKTFLVMEGYKVLEATNGEEALKLLNKNKVSLVFTDIKMPGMSGTELLKAIKKYDKTITVIVMTAFGTIKNAVECTKLGASTYLQKPFTVKRVKVVLDEVLKKDSLRNNVNIYINLGKKLILEDNYDKAEEILNKALTLSSSNGEIYYLLGEVNEKKENFDVAKKFKETAKIFGFTETI
ncbi:TPR repeat-containing protein [Clostridium cavendishii DSM 21758]|uniref:Stage 0 sporulation protein A homolog n=1 Tax=Clostridium cavendishii DSM 21758 TaxID=1121302 RepID=A0A1M6CJF2_9CLOT|nr:response regulator [Clostridium cavendishii]SHI60818.1 TPR repeat-containing protein [Clostridium cavendishii DSM 21758]